MGSDGARVWGDSERSTGGHESFSKPSPVGFNGLGLPLRLWNISTYDRDTCVCPGAAVDTSCMRSCFSPPSADSRLSLL